MCEIRDSVGDEDMDVGLLAWSAVGAAISERHPQGFLIV